MIDQIAANVPSSHDSSRPENSGMVLIRARTISGRSKDSDPSCKEKRQTSEEKLTLNIVSITDRIGKQSEYVHAKKRTTHTYTHSLTHILRKRL